MRIPEPPDFSVAARFLRKMAPAQQTHQDRRNLQAAAKALEGAKLSSDNMAVIYDYPVEWEGKLIGHAQFIIMCDGSIPRVTVRFNEIESHEADACEEDICVFPPSDAQTMVKPEYLHHERCHNEPVEGCPWCFTAEQLTPPQYRRT